MAKVLIPNSDVIVEDNSTITERNILVKVKPEILNSILKDGYLELNLKLNYDINLDNYTSINPTVKNYIDTQDNTRVSKNGDTINGPITLNYTASNALHAINKKDVQQLISNAFNSAVSSTQLTQILQNYVTSSQLQNITDNIITNDELSTALSTKADISQLSDKVDTTTFNQAISNFVTNNDLNIAINTLRNELMTYIDNKISLYMNYEKRYSYNDPYIYIGTAPINTLNSSPTWDITRLTVDATGTVIQINNATGAWDSRETLLY